MGNIMASTPSSHLLFGGHRGALDWLQRFLKALPPAPTSPLPLFTAPVLTGFLSAAGHMLANKHEEDFKRELSIVVDSVVPRLDDGPIGKPSSIRLSKLLEGGFEAFATKLPSKAMGELYYGARYVEKKETVPTSNQPGFSSGNQTGVMAGPTGSNANPFASNQNAAAPSSVGFSVSDPFVSNKPMNNDPFGSNKPMNNDPFGSNKPMNSGSSGIANPFASASNGPNRWNNTQQTQGFSTSTFASSSTSTSPFGTGSAPPTGGMGFGSNSNNQANQQRPWGQGTTSQQSPWGQNNSTNIPMQQNKRSGFNGGGKKSSKSVCKFFLQGNYRYGDRCKFSHDTSMNSSSSGAQSSQGFSSFQQGGMSGGRKLISQANTAQNPFGGGGW